MLNDKNTEKVCENQKNTAGNQSTPAAQKDESVKYFHSLEKAHRFIYGTAKRDDFADVWQDLGFDFPKQKSFKTDHNKKKKLRIYGVGYAFGADTGNVFDYLEKYENYSNAGVYDYLAKIYNIEFEIAEYKASKTASKPRTPQTNLPATKTEYKGVQIDKKANKAYFERLCKEYGLELENPFFSICENGFKISYTDLDGKSFPYNKGVYSRQRYFIPLQGKNGKTQKYHTPSKLNKNAIGYFPYLTPLAYYKDLLGTTKTLYGIEGEKKALFGVKELGLLFFGSSGHALGTITEKHQITGKSIKETAVFHSQIIDLIEKENITSYCLLLDSDVFDNEGDKNRALSFFSTYQKECIAAQKAGITELTFSIVSPNNPYKAKGLDDYNGHVSAAEIKEKLENKTHHNDLFWHFRIDTTKHVNSALHRLKLMFLASAEKKTVSKVFEFDTKYIPSSFFTSNIFSATLCESDIITQIVAGCGLGKSYFFKEIFAKQIQKENKAIIERERLFFEKESHEKQQTIFKDDSKQKYKSYSSLQIEKKHVILFVCPRNSLALQQAAKGGYICYTAHEKYALPLAIQRTFKEIDNYGIVYSNVDNAKTAYQTLKDTNRKVILVFDESHLGSSDAAFRGEEIKRLFTIIRDATKTYFISATPRKLANFEFENIVLKRSELSKFKEKEIQPTVFLGSAKEHTKIALNQIRKALKNNLSVIIRFNSIEKLNILRQALKMEEIESYLFSTDDDINEEDKKIYTSVVNSDPFVWRKNDPKRVILTTSCIEQGVNLKTEKEYIDIFVNGLSYGFELESYTQFHNRFRNKSEFCKGSFVITTNLKNPVPSIDLVSSFDVDKELENAKKAKDYYNSQYQIFKSKNDNTKAQNLKSNAISDCYLFYDKDLDSFEISEILLEKESAKHRVSQLSYLMTNPKKIVIVSDNEIQDNTFEVAKKSNSDLREAAEKKIYQCVHKDFVAFLIASKEAFELKDNKLVDKIKKDLYYHFDNDVRATNEFKLEGKKEKDVAKLFLQIYFRLLKTGASREYIKSVLSKEEEERILNPFELKEASKTQIIYYYLVCGDKKLFDTFSFSDKTDSKPFKRLVKLFENREEMTKEEVLKLANYKQKANKKENEVYEPSLNPYSSFRALKKVLDLLFNIETIKENGKRKTTYSFGSPKDFVSIYLKSRDK